MVLFVHFQESPDFYHLHWIVGQLGVAVFFVLSGFLITTLALREEEDTGWVSLRAFYVRRTFRIFPLYYLTLAVYVAAYLGLHAKPEQEEPFRETLPAFVLYYPEVPLQAAEYQFRLPFTQAWSLGIEEKFYLVWPLLAFVALARRPAGRFGLTLVLFAAFGATPALLDLGRPHLGMCLLHYFHIVVGCLLAQALHDRRRFARLDFLASPVAASALQVGLVVATAGFPAIWNLGDGGWFWMEAYSVLAAAVLVGVLRGPGGCRGCCDRDRCRSSARSHTGFT